MGKLVFIPSYNDCKQAYKLAKQTTRHPEVDTVLIIDDSDTPECINYYKSHTCPKLRIIQGKRRGKWAAWRTALQIAQEHDDLIQIDADVELVSITPIIEALKTHDLVTPHVRFKPPLGSSWVARKMTEVYQRSHQQSYDIGKANLGGQVIGLSRHAVNQLNHYSFFHEHVIADDYVVALAVKSMGGAVATVDSGVSIRLPGNTWEWIRYKTRHSGAVAWAKNYVKQKLGDSTAVEEASSEDYRQTVRIFLENCIKTSPLMLLVFLLLTLVSLLPLEDKSQWKPLGSTKMRILSALSLWTNL